VSNFTSDNVSKRSLDEAGKKSSSRSVTYETAPRADTTLHRNAAPL
jgi:hypothetical protein